MFLIQTLTVYNCSIRCFIPLLARANYKNCNSVCSPSGNIHLLRQVKPIGKSGELHWEDYQLKTTLLFIVGTDA